VKIATTIIGIGGTAQDRAAALVQQAIAKREAELLAARGRGPAAGTIIPAAQGQGGK
jgi:hypothetical protein